MIKINYQKQLAAVKIFPEMALAHQWCKGEGLEYGAAAHNPFGLPGARNVAPYSEDPDHPDHADFELYRRAQVSLCGGYAHIDLCSDARKVDLPDHTQDFIISSHVIEHISDPIAVFEEANRLLKVGGIFFMIFPKRDAHVPDRLRPITSLDYFINIYLGLDYPDPKQGHRGHFCVYTLKSMLELLDWCEDFINLDWEIVATEETDSKVGNGHTVVARKRS